MFREDELGVVDAILIWTAPIALIASSFQAAALRTTVILAEDQSGVV
jgi:hypothetical protein